MRWIVDAYNVLLCDQRMSQLMKIDGDAARRELVSTISGSWRLSKDDVTLVFDGRFAPSSSHEGPRLVVRFTSASETADDWIKKEVGKSTRRRSMTVVSNDLSILAYAKECGAATVRSREFLSMVRGKDKPAKRTQVDDEKPVSAGKLDKELLELFRGKKK